MQMKTIAIYITSLVGGGSERFSVVLANGLAQKGYDIRILTGPVKEHEYAINPSVNRNVLHEKLSIINNAKTLRRYLKKEKIDICIAVGIYPNLVAALANTCLKTHVILSERNAPKEDRLSVTSRILRKLLFWRGDAFVFQTPDAKAFYSSRIQKRGVVIPNPLKENLPHRAEKHNKEIIAVGRLMPQKNYPMLLQAFSLLSKSHPEYTLRIFGRGMLLTELEAYAKELGIYDHVLFEGFAINVHEQIRESDIYVMTSNFEGLPNALMEAMAMGFPVISTDCPCGGPRMLIEHGRNGLLVPVNNSIELSKAICQFIENTEFKEQCAHEALKISEKCSLASVVVQWEKLFSYLK